MWTTTEQCRIDAAFHPLQSIRAINVLQTSMPTTPRLTLCLGDPTGQSQTTITQIIEVLPQGFTYASPSNFAAKLVDNNGNVKGTLLDNNGKPIPEPTPTTSPTPCNPPNPTLCIKGKNFS